MQRPHPRWIFRLASVSLAAAGAVHGQTTSEAMLNYHNGDLGYVHGTAGWTFQTQTNLSVTSLGYLAEYAGWLAGWGYESVSVGLWASDGSLLRSCSVTTNSTLVNDTRYEPISAVLLVPGPTYCIGASGVRDGLTYLRVVVPAQGGYATMASQVRLGVGAWALNSIFEFPAPYFDAPGTAFVGPNFQFTFVQPALRLAINVTNHSALLTISGSSSSQARLEWVTNASDWTAPNVLTTNTVPYSFIDPGSSNSAARFYRAVNIE